MTIQHNPIKRIVVEFESGEVYKLELKNNTETRLSVNITTSDLDLHIHSYDELIMEKNIMEN
jgi:hypothetical protein